MIEERHIETLKEVHETIEESIKDPRGFLPRQRRLAAMLSLGSAHLVELYFHRLNAIKPGMQIKHDWLQSEIKNIKIHLIGFLTKNIDNLPQSEKILSLAHEIELKRNELVYGVALKNDLILKEKLNLFLELKKIIEEVIGEVKW